MPSKHAAIALFDIRDDNGTCFARIQSMNVQRVCVYCASSRQCNPVYHQAAAELGRELAVNGVTIVYGGGLAGSMGALANAALAARGKVIGILPQFMFDLEWVTIV